MMSEFNFNECVNDSPKFRKQLNKNEQSLEDLESRLERLLKTSSTASESGKNHMSALTQFLASLWELSAYFASEKEHRETTANLNKLIQGLQEVIKMQNNLIDSCHKSASKSMSKFLKDEVKQMKDTRGYFNKISTDLDSALAKNAAASKGKQNEIEDAANLLTATKSCFRYTTLDYVYQISMLQSKKKHVALKSVHDCFK